MSGELDAEDVLRQIRVALESPWTGSVEVGAAAMALIVAEVDRLRECITGWREEVAAAEARADAAGDVVERVRALADEARSRKAAYPRHPHWSAWDHYESDLRDILASSDADATHEESDRIRLSSAAVATPEEDSGAVCDLDHSMERNPKPGPGRPTFTHVFAADIAEHPITDESEEG